LPGQPLLYVPILPVSCPYPIYSQPDSAWRRISLPALTRIYGNPKVLEEHVTLSGYEGELRQLTVMELGHEEPTLLWTNHRQLGAVELVTRYAQRMLIENGISEAVPFFHIDSLSSRRDESGFRHAVDTHGQFAISHDGSAHRQGIPPLAGQDGLSPSPECTVRSRLPPSQ
jgi:hypothetical protein